MFGMPREPKQRDSIRAGSVLIKIRTREGVEVVDVEGDLKIGESVAAFEGLVQDLSRRDLPVVLNLAKLKAIDSRGIGAIVDAKVKLGPRVCMICLSDRIQSLLAICKLTTLMPIYPSEVEALTKIRAPHRNERMSRRSIAFFD